MAKSVAVAVAIVLELAARAWCAGPPPGFARLVEEALGTKPGGVVVMRVSDGKVLAIANPDVSCVQTHPPGSIFKIVTATAALAENLTRNGEVFRCSGKCRVADHTLYCTVPNGHGSLRIKSAIAQSCNVTFYALGTRLGSARLIRYARLFGLDSPVRSYPGRQTAGTLPRRSLHPAESARLAIGQADGMRITLLGAAEMVRRVATCDAGPCGAEGDRVRAALAVVRQGMREAVVSGTCRSMDSGRATVAGKTGSPEDSEASHHREGWFVGFAPADNPEIVVVVFVKRGRGGTAAAPVAGRIFSAYFSRGGFG